MKRDRKFFQIIRKRLWVIVTVAIGLVGTTVGLSLMQPAYKGASVLAINAGLALAGALMLGVGLVALLEYLDSLSIKPFRTLTPLPSFMRAGFTVIGALLLTGAAMALFIRLAHFDFVPHWLYLLLIVLLIPLGAIAVLKIWARPALGVAVTLVVIAVPWRTGGEGAELAHITLPDLAAAALVGIVTVRVLVLGDQGRLRSWVLLPLAGVVVAGLVATLMAWEPIMSISGLIRYAEVFVMIPTATYLALESRRDLKLILGAVLALGVFEGIIGVYQFLTATGANFQGANIRAVGTFDPYNIMGLATIITYALIAAVAAYVGLRGGHRWWALLLALALLFPLAFALSRGQWIAAALGVMVVVALNNWKNGILFALVVGLILTYATYYAASSDSDIVAQRFNSLYNSVSEPDQSVRDRYAMWQAALDMWSNHPVGGVGLKNFVYFRDAYAPFSFYGKSTIGGPGEGPLQRLEQVELLTPHNQYLVILAEQGFLGALAYGAFFLSLVFAAFYRLREFGKASAERVFGLFVSGALVSILVAQIYGDLGGSTAVLNAVLFGCLLWVASGAKFEEA